MSPAISHDPPAPTDRRAADRLLVSAAGAAGRWLGLMGLTALVLALAETALPAVLGRAVDALVVEGVPRSWVLWCALLVAVLAVTDAADDVAAGSSVAGSTGWLRHTLLGHVLALTPRAAANLDAGDLTSRLVANAAEAGRIGPQVVRFATNLVPAVGSIVALAWIDPRLALTFVAGLPVLLVAVRIVTRDATDVAEQYMRTQGVIAGRLTEALSGVRTIAAAGTVDREVERVLAPLPELRHQGLRMWRLFARISVQQSLVVPLLEIAVLSTAGVLLARGHITPGELLAAAQYAALGARVGTVETLIQLSRSRAGATRVAAVLGEPRMEYGGGRLTPGRGRVELRGVTVTVGGERLLDDIDLDVAAGTLVGIVGPTGAGKSLLAGLLSRLVEPDDGQVLVDGVPVHELSRHELRHTVGHAFAHPVLMGETMADAIAFGDERPAFTDVVSAARAAQADGFIRRMPRGYETPLVEAAMSGGEVQRVGLARTFAHAGRVLVLDDAASSLDTVTDHLIRQVLTGPLSGRTRFLVVRRAATAAAVDVVVWLEGGRIRAVAPHATLWEDPDYRLLFEPERAASLTTEGARL